MIHISAYRFVTLYDTGALKLWLRDLCARLEIKGSVVLSVEGINLMLSGESTVIDQFCTELMKDERFKGMWFKKTYAPNQVFKRLFIKQKAHLVPGFPEIRPDLGDVAKALTPAQLRDWYEAGKTFTIIDTRNDYEYEVGSFENALNLNLTQFSELSDKLKELPDSVKKQPVVLFCTGGIRCEKGAPAAQKLGFQDVYQLEGGIVNYLAECGHAHYRGDCFVFDERVSMSGEDSR